jgi:ADP-ribose pyrophosphatase YjhB (NUDIX family)
VLIVRRARPPAGGLYTLPGGGVEVGESLVEAVAREVLEETGLTVAPVALAGYREAIVRDGNDRIERHFVILPFAARWIAGEPVLNEELSEAAWRLPSELAGLKTTQGLAEIIASAFALIGEPQSSLP